MNNITNFRLCTLSDDELLQRVDELTDKAYQDNELPAIHIPARSNKDFDLLIGELILRYREQKEIIENLKKEQIAIIGADKQALELALQLSKQYFKVMIIGDNERENKAKDVITEISNNLVKPLKIAKINSLKDSDFGIKPSKREKGHERKYKFHQ